MDTYLEETQHTNRLNPNNSGGAAKDRQKGTNSEINEGMKGREKEKESEMRKENR